MKPIQKNRRISHFTQTTTTGNSYEFAESDDVESNYTRALDFLNKCHCFFNEVIQENLKKGNNIKESCFKFPEVPNYYVIFNILKCSDEKIDNSLQFCEKKDDFLSNMQEIPDFLFIKEDLKSFSNSTMVIDGGKKSEIIENPSGISCLAKHVKNCAVNVQATDFFDDKTKSIIEGIIQKTGYENLNSILKPEVDKNTNNNIKMSKSNHQISNNNVQPSEVNILDYKRKKIEKPPMHIKKHAKSEMIFANQSHVVRPSTPKLVNEMFKKISKENIKEDFIEKKFGDCQSDDDSIIFDDDEYEKLKNGFKISNKKTDEVENKTNLLFVNSGRNAKFNHGNFLDQNIKNMTKNSGICEPMTQCHPLQLTGKNKSRVDERALNVIGLFTERGDIRPGVIDIIEQKKITNAKNEKNVEFRKKRQPQVAKSIVPVNTFDYFGRSLSISSNDSLVSAVYSDVKTDSEFEFVQIQQSQIHLRNKHM